MKNYFIHLLLFVLSYIVPKKKNLIILGSGDGKQFQGNPKYMAIFLSRINDCKIEYYWSVKSKKQQQQVKLCSLPFINPYSLKGFWKILRAQYQIIEKSSFDTYYLKSIFGNFNFIQTCHGSPQKKFGVDAIGQNSSLPLTSNQDSMLYKLMKKLRFFSRHKYKLILSPSPYVETIYKRAFENNRTFVTGYPRNDVFFDLSLAVEDYFNQFQLGKFEKVILYAPTFRDNQDSLRPLSADLDRYNEELKNKNYLLLVKKHPWQKSFSIPEGLSNILDLSNKVDDIQELLPRIDLLITDYSGTVFDFMLTNKPVIFYPYDLENYLKNCRGLYLDYYKDLPGPFAHNESELFQLIFTVDEWEKEPAYRQKYKALLDRFNQFQDGHSSERLLNLLYPDFGF